MHLSGLYNSSDSVTVLTVDNFNQTVYDRSTATFVEFYNSFCGACQRFAITYRALAKELEPWRPIADIAACDCANENNNALCRNMEVMRYPTLRYFAPKSAVGSLGTDMDHLILPTLDVLIDEFAGHLVNETQGSEKWPIFTKYSEADGWLKMFDDVTDADVKYIYVVSDELPGMLAQQAVLDFVGNDDINVRIVESANRDLMVSSFTLHISSMFIDKFFTHIFHQAKPFQLGAVDRDGNFEMLSIHNESRISISKSIKEHMKRHHIASVVSSSSERPEYEHHDNLTITSEVLLNRKFYDDARKMTPMPLFRADLEKAIRKTLSHEIPQHETISGEALSALRHFVSVLYRYYDFGNKSSFRKLLDYLVEPSRREVKGSEFKAFVESLNPPIVRRSRYIGCFSTQNGLRRFPCSLWSLFHHLTVQHLESDEDEDPMEVLQAMHGYIKHFFGCTDCSKHFQEMAKRNHIWNVTSKDQAVLWLWSAHNEVNERLSGDVTEDKNHPKIQFPAEDSCHVCRKKTSEWDKSEVLEFLRRHYANAHVSDLGMDMDQIPRAMMLNARARQMFAGGLGETHLHIGILAYVAVIVFMMVAAVKFYFRRGYRKKLYAHDILGKV